MSRPCVWSTTDGVVCGRDEDDPWHDPVSVASNIEDPRNDSLGFSLGCHPYRPSASTPEAHSSGEPTVLQRHVDALATCPAEGCGFRSGGNTELLAHIEQALYPAGQRVIVYGIKSGRDHYVHLEEVPGTRGSPGTIDGGCGGAFVATCRCGWKFPGQGQHPHQHDIIVRTEAGFHLGLMTAMEMIRMRDTRSSDGYHRTKMGA